ncbi:MAG: beta-N-acetylhexosaminidase [Deltaproteobacteria bacterium]|nr:beta-N-acetylhexosaminidase [Deltaproteobacteria bacterium]
MGTNREFSEINTKIWQLFMAGLPGPSLDEDTENLIRDYNLGGMILFARNIRDPIQVARLCRDIQDRAMKYHGFPLLLAIDQEGGRVARLGEPFTPFPGNSAIGMDRDPVERAIEFAEVTGKEMRLVGLNMNLAPVVDVQRGVLEKHLLGRTFGEDPEKVALLGKTVIRTLQENGVMAVAKHFPGLGRAGIDPHLDLPRIDSDKAEIEKINLLPFRAAVDEEVTGIMTSHSIYTALDPELPATMSRPIVTDLLRERMGYDGLILSDDLEMGAIVKQWGVARGAAQAFESGVDVLLICKEQKYILESLDLIKTRILKGAIPLQRLQQSFERIGKRRKGLLKEWEKISIPGVREYFNL